MKLTQQARISILKRKCDQLIFNMFRKKNKQRFEPEFKPPSLNFKINSKKNLKEGSDQKNLVFRSIRNKKIKKSGETFSLKKINFVSLSSY